MSIRVDALHVDYGHRSKVSVHLGSTFNGRTVSLYAARIGTSDGALGQRIAHGRVGKSGNLATTFAVTRLTRFTVTYAGDYRSAAASDRLSVHVRSKIVLALGNYVGRSGAYYVYRAADPVARVHVLTKRPGACVSLTAQLLSRGSWRTIDTLSCAGLDASSYAYISFTSGHVNGLRYRIHANVKANAYSEAKTSTWKYFTFG